MIIAPILMTALIYHTSIPLLKVIRYISSIICLINYS
jgi:hypothetical protein